MSRNRSHANNRNVTRAGHRTPAPQPTTNVPDLAARTEALATEIRGLRLQALQKKHHEVFGRTTRAKVRTALIMKIAAELARRDPPGATLRSSAQHAVRGDEPRRRGRRGRFTGMTIEQLQALYAESIGRSTNSTDRRYLEWKLREAAKGRIALGPKERSTGIAEGGEMMTLPWRIPRALVDAMDHGWRALHFKTRSAFLAAAVGGLFETKGDRALARRFGVHDGDAA